MLVFQLVTTVALVSLLPTLVIFEVWSQSRALQAETRTAKLRIEVPNANGQLRLGMFVNAQVGEAEARPGVLIPKSALQAVGDATVVYVADPRDEGRYVERRVQVANSADGQVLVVSGLQAGDRVVTEGAFFLRAESERSGRR